MATTTHWKCSEVETYLFSLGNLFQNQPTNQAVMLLPLSIIEGQCRFFHLPLMSTSRHQFFQNLQQRPNVRTVFDDCALMGLSTIVCFGLAPSVLFLMTMQGT